MNDQIRVEPPHGEALIELIQSYLTTDYHVASPAGSLTFHIAQQNAEHDMTLIAAGVERWAIMTAWNPHSQLRSWEENEEAQDRLKRVIENREFKWWEGASNHPANNWPTEESCLVLNIVSKEARELCRMFDQLAVVVGETGEEPWLLFADWEGVGPLLKQSIVDNSVLKSFVSLTIERNDALGQQ